MQRVRRAISLTMPEGLNEAQFTLICNDVLEHVRKAYGTWLNPTLVEKPSGISSISEVQRIIVERDALRAEVERLRALQRASISTRAFIQDLLDEWPLNPTRDRLEEMVGGVFASLPMLDKALAALNPGDTDAK